MHTPHSKLNPDRTGSQPPGLSRFLATEADTLALGAELAQALAPGMVIYLVGDLGAGKTTLARGVLRGLGYMDKVKSPTYTLVEVYKLSRLYLYHFDFYRFADPSEWETAGLAECFRSDSACLVEWPERVGGLLPVADVELLLTYGADSDAGRYLDISAHTAAGERCLAAIAHSTTWTAN